MEINDFFDALETECNKEKTYSVVKTIEKMGINPQDILKATDVDGGINPRLQKCRDLCKERIGKVLNSRNGPEKFGLLEMMIDGEYSKDMHEFVQEREDERREQEEKQESEKELEKKQKELKKAVYLSLPYSNRWPQENKSETQSSEASHLSTESEQKNWVAQWHEQRTSEEEKRLKVWREKHAKESIGYGIEKNEDKSNSQSIFLENKFDKPDLSPEEQNKILAANLCAETGVASPLLGGTIFAEVVNAVEPIVGGNVGRVAVTHEALLAMKPKDIYEGMLCGRLWVLHSQSMQFMARTTSPEQTNAGVDSNINRATKLMRLYNETQKALETYRRKGEQKVVVQHVNVNSGGQAIVGSKINNQGGRDNDKK